MSSKIKSLSYIKTIAVAVDKNKQQQSLQKDFRNVVYNNSTKNSNGIEELKRKIDTITRYQKPYISKMLNELSQVPQLMSYHFN